MDDSKYPALNADNEIKTDSFDEAMSFETNVDYVHAYILETEESQVRQKGVMAFQKHEGKFIPADSNSKVTQYLCLHSVI